jgi:serine protease
MVEDKPNPHTIGGAMKKLLLACLFVLGIGFAIFNFPGLANQGEFNSVIVDFKESLSSSQIQSEVKAIAQNYGASLQLNSEFSRADNLYVVKGDSKLLKALKKSSLGQETEYIEPNYIYKALEVPNDPEYTKQWNLRAINIESAWDDSKGDGVTVAVIDTGIAQVPDLKETKFVAGYDFVNNRADATDDNGHGTHVAGTVAQATNNNYGTAGIAYKASLMPLKVLSQSGAGTVSDIAEGIKFAADNGADVINMSLGGGGESHLMQEAINYAHNKGVVIVAAAGNSGENSADYPARYPKVIGVAATDAAGGKAPYSNFGAGVDIAAPGGSTSGGSDRGGILQETIDYQTGQPRFISLEGTSMASPHVAGVAALVKASGIEEPDDVLRILKQSARVAPNDALNEFGAGHLDAAQAVKEALKGQITFKDFFRWLRDNGYLNPRFWIDGGAVALLPKIGMVIGSYLLAWFLRNYFPFPWSWSLSAGLVAGSSGIFFLRGLYIFDIPQWPFRVMGSSLPELGNIVQGSSILNPLFASVVIPLILVVLLLGHAQGKWLAIGTCLGVASCLMVNALISPSVWGLGSGIMAQTFLIVNAVLCVGLAYLAAKPGERLAG